MRKDKKIIITIVRQNLEIKTELICITSTTSTDTYFHFMFFSRDIFTIEIETVHGKLHKFFLNEVT